MTPADLKAWLSRHSLTLDTGAYHLGIGRRSLANYVGGHAPVPTYVSLLCWFVDRFGLAKTDLA